MPTLDSHPAFGQPPAHLDLAHAFVLLDALNKLNLSLDLSLDDADVRPWESWQERGRPGMEPTEAVYRGWMAQAGAVLFALVQTEMPGILVPYSGDEASAAAALNLRTYQAEDDARSGRIVVDVHGVTVDVARRADHTAVDVNTVDVPDEFRPVRVMLGDDEPTDPYAYPTSTFPAQQEEER